MSGTLYFLPTRTLHLIERDEPHWYISKCDTEFDKRAASLTNREFTLQPEDRHCLVCFPAQKKLKWEHKLAVTRLEGLAESLDAMSETEWQVVSVCPIVSMFNADVLVTWKRERK